MSTVFSKVGGREISERERMGGRWTLLAVLVGLLLGGALAQTPSGGRSTPGVQDVVPRLVASSEKGLPAMVLEGLEVEAEVVGPLVETRLTMTFRNPHGRLLEGELKLPLPEGAFVCGYALDVNGKMVDGVAVDKDEGRRIFEAVVRRGVDPGLVEWMSGNAFRTRVYPLPVGGTRTVMVRYVSEVERDGGSWRYRLPLAYGVTVKRFALRVSVVGAEEPPVVMEAGPTELREEKMTREWVAEVQGKEVDLSRDLVIRLPAPRPGASWVQKARDGQTYFLSTVEVPQVKMAAPPLPRRVALFWDASGSSARMKRSAVEKVLTAFFRRCAEALMAVDVVVFRHRVEKPRSLVVKGGNAAPLLALLAGIQPDGATSLAALPGPELPERPDLCLLVSDGLASWGTGSPGAFPAPLYALTTSSGANHLLLRELAERNGGEYLDLTRVEPKAASERIGKPPLLLLPPEADPARVDQCVPSRPVVVSGDMLVAGRLMARDAQVELKWGGAARDVMAQTRNLSRAEAPEGELLRVYWAQRRLAELAVDPEGNREELKSLGKAHGLVTPATSLLVLDSLEQYVRNGVEPPASFPEWREAWARQIGENKSRQESDQNERLERLVKKWTERVEWWEGKWSEKEETTTGSRSGSESPSESCALPIRETGPVGSSSCQTPPLLHGKVVDRSGAGIPSADLILIDSGTGVAKTSRSDDGGNYCFQGLRPGCYDLRVTQEEYSTFKMPGIQISAGERLSLPVLLNVSDNKKISIHQVSIRVMPERGFVGDNPYSIIRRVTASGTIVPDSMSDISSPPSPGRAQFSDRNADPGFSTSSRRTTTLAEGEPDAHYAKVLERAGREKVWGVYIKKRKKNADSPGFFLDCADILLRKGLRDEAEQVLSNLAEQAPEDSVQLRTMAHRLTQADFLEPAGDFFARVVRLRPEEPQSFRDLGLLRARQKRYTEALELLRKVVMGEWGRFNPIRITALTELNAMLPAAREAGVKSFRLDPRLEKLLDMDLRILLSWDLDNTDMDLCVVINGDSVGRKNRHSKDGSLFYHDNTEGYGPEEYMLRRTRRGRTYCIKVENYSADAWLLFQPVNLRVEIITGFGRPDEKRKTINRRIDPNTSVLDIGEVTF